MYMRVVCLQKKVDERVCQTNVCGICYDTPFFFGKYAHMMD